MNIRDTDEQEREVAQDCQMKAELAESRAEVDRLRALVARQHEALRPVTGLLAAGDRVRADEPAIVEARACLSDPDGQRAAEEWAALLKVQRHARRISTHPRAMRRDEAWYGLGDALREYDRLRAVQEGKGEGDGR